MKKPDKREQMKLWWKELGDTILASFESALIEAGVCPKCHKGRMVAKGAIGQDRRNQEVEAEWKECDSCGFSTDAQ